MSLQCFDCFNEDLTEVPSVPEGTQVLNVYQNRRLTHLPEDLPDSLEVLHVFSTGLVALPSKLPPKLRVLSVEHTALSSLPSSQPETLTDLYFEGTAVPPDSFTQDSFPPHVVRLQTTNPEVERVQSKPYRSFHRMRAWYPNENVATEVMEDFLGRKMNRFTMEMRHRKQTR